MNAYVTFSIAIVAGLIAGIIYGLFYVYKKKRVLAALHERPSRARYYLIYLGPIARIAFIATLIVLLLRYPTIPFILTIICFLVGFWLAIFFKGVL